VGQNWTKTASSGPVQAQSEHETWSEPRAEEERKKPEPGLEPHWTPHDDPPDRARMTRRREAAGLTMLEPAKPEEQDPWDQI